MTANESTLMQEKIRIAACPTYHEMAKKLDIERYEIIETQSTAQSLKLLQDQSVAMIIAGRVLKRTEPAAKSHIICDTGYSFLSASSKIINTKELEHLPIFTDLDVSIISEIFGAKHIRQVPNVYQYLDMGIIITSWKNTDYSQAAIVHVMDNENTRSALSRRPTIYYLQSVGKIVEEVSAKLMTPS